jgi:hypothetical protein
MYLENASKRGPRSYSDTDSHREEITLGMQDKFNEGKDRLSEEGENVRDRGEELYNKAKGSREGERDDNFADTAKEKAQDTVGRMKGDDRRRE